MGMCKPNSEGRTPFLLNLFGCGYAALGGSSADPETVEALSEEFQASSYVIQWQLENAGVALSSD
jgi:hypothetical protein